ncbi:MAG: four helix bundle protein [Flavobacteriales bacterium]
MSKFVRFEEIESWKLLRELSRDLHDLFGNGKFKNDYTLWNQINGSSGSIMDNIAEGQERGGRKEFIQFLSFAKGSCGETRSQLYRMLDRKYINEGEFSILVEKAEHCSRKINNLMTYLQGTTIQGGKFRF